MTLPIRQESSLLNIIRLNLVPLNSLWSPTQKGQGIVYLNLQQHAKKTLLRKGLLSPQQYHLGTDHLNINHEIWKKKTLEMFDHPFADQEIKVQEGVIDWLEEISLDIMLPNSSSPRLFTLYYHTFWNMSVTKGTSLKLWLLIVFGLVLVQLQYLALCF